MTAYESGASRRLFTCYENHNRKRGGREDGKELSCHSSGGELFAPRVARLSEHEGHGDEHALFACVFVSMPLALTLAPASGGRASSLIL